MRQYADIPEKKRVDEIDLAPFLKSGNNELYVVAAHMGEDFSVAGRWRRLSLSR